MSFTLMAKVMPLNIGSLAKKMVLLKLADQASDDGYCWPSYQTIADACQVSRRTVIRHIKNLEDEGYLTITRVYDKANKKNSSNRYQLTIDRGVKMSLVTEIHHPSDTVSISGDTVSPKPIIESIIEPDNKPTKKATKYKPEKPESVSEQVWEDLLMLRKSKKGVDSKTAWTTIFNALEKAQQATGHSLEQIITEWVTAEWRSFKFDWYMNRINSNNKNQPSSTDNNSNRTYHQSQPPQSKQQSKQHVTSSDNGEDLRAKFLESF